MGKLEHYQTIIERILGEHLEQLPQEDEIEVFALNDRDSGHFMILEVGWQPPQRIYNIVFHIALKDDKIWIEQDMTEYGVARELIEAGIPSEVIELGFQPPEMRPHIDWAVTVGK